MTDPIEQPPEDAPEIEPAPEETGEPAPTRSPGEAHPAPCQIAALGASAGGLEALEIFFDNLPADTGLAFVVIQHLSPDYKSLMAELLSRHTSMKVLRAEDGMPVQPNHVYLIPPKHDMTIQKGRLRLSRPTQGISPHLPIDIFFRSLAEECGENAVGIVLSGTGSDGMRGVRAIKEAGGIVLVQDETQARFDGMPRSAISTGLVDLILPVEAMPAELLSLIQACSAEGPRNPGPVQRTDEEQLARVIELVRRQSTVDFTYYKPATLLRRIERRMNVNQTPYLADYVQVLEQSPRERITLYKELLIGVTKFFRDGEAFTLLEQRVIAEIFAQTLDGEPIRVWVPACSTGEEAYSLAMLFREYADAHRPGAQIKIFATDIDKESVEYAAAGLYPESIVADVSPARLNRFFTRRKDHFQVNRSIRELVIFAFHNLIKDPPMTRIDLVSCRNLLIYLQPVLQKKALSLLTYALKSRGFLLLGNSESVGSLHDFFETIDSRWKLYRSVSSGRSSLTEILTGPTTRLFGPGGTATRAGRVQAEEEAILERVHQELLEVLGMRCLVVDAEGRLLHCFGAVSDFLQMQPGRASLDIFRIITPPLSVPLRMALARAAKDHREVTYHQIQVGDGSQPVTMRVRPLLLGGDRPPVFLVLIAPESTGQPRPAVPSLYETDRQSIERIGHLEGELQYTRENLQATIEELETANEELQATNEELLAANEELQSTNEELQSLNEELQTVNAEYQQKIEELIQLNLDIENMLRVTEVGIIFVDEQLCIRKFTPAVNRLLHVMPQDVGRPLDHISTKPPGLPLAEKARAVLQGALPLEEEVRHPEGPSLVVRFLPYLTEENAVEGVIIHAMDVTNQKQGEYRLQAVLDAIPAWITVLDEEGRLRLVNRSWNQFVQQSDPAAAVTDLLGQNYLETCLRVGIFEEPAAQKAQQGILDILEERTATFSLEFPSQSVEGERWYLMHAAALKTPVPSVMVWHLDITPLKQVCQKFHGLASEPGTADLEEDSPGRKSLLP